MDFLPASKKGEMIIISSLLIFFIYQKSPTNRNITCMTNTPSMHAPTIIAIAAMINAMIPSFFNIMDLLAILYSSFAILIALINHFFI